jgi:hypothetical protein
MYHSKISRGYHRKAHSSDELALILSLSHNVYKDKVFVYAVLECELCDFFHLKKFRGGNCRHLEE